MTEAKQNPKVEAGRKYLYCHSCGIPKSPSKNHLCRKCSNIRNKRLRLQKEGKYDTPLFPMETKK